MNLAELKEKILEKMKHLGFSRIYSEIVINNFLQYEQANSSEDIEPVIQPEVIGTMDVKLKRRTQEEMITHLITTVENNRQNHAKEIKALKAEIEKQKECISGINTWLEDKNILGMKADIQNLISENKLMDKKIDLFVLSQYKDQMPTPEKKYRVSNTNIIQFMGRSGIWVNLCIEENVHLIKDALNAQEAGK